MAIVTLRPDGTAKADGVTLTGAGTAHGALGDNDLGTYVTGNTENGVVYLALQTSALGSLRLKSAQLRIQNAHGAGGGVQTAWARFRDSANGQVTVPNFTMERGTTTVSQQRGALEYKAPGGGAWSQTLLDRLQVEIAWKKAADGNFMRVHELYVDLETNTRPSIATPTVTGETSTTRPTVTWVYSDTESDPQTRYQAKVFSAAQYGPAGFSADTATATWDSGQRYGSQDSLYTEIDLTNGTTYKAYVRVAQEWPGPDDGNAGVWWSTWVASAAFTVAVVPPPAPTLTGLVIADRPGLRALLTADAPLNLLSSNAAGFELGIDDWQQESNCSVAQSATNPKSGAQCLAVTATAAADAVARSGAFASAMRVRSGSQYTVLASLRAATTGRTVNAGVKWYNQAGGVISLQYGSNVTDTTGGYTQATATFTAPAGAYAAHALARIVAPGAGEVHRLDEVSLHAGASTTWTQGGYRPTADVVLEVGQRVDPALGPARNWMRPQIATGGSELRDSTGFRLAGGSADLLAWEPLDRSLPGGPPGGQHWSLRTAANGLLYVGGADPAVSEDPLAWVLPIAPGRGHTFSGWLWRGANAVTVFAYLDWLNSSADFLSSTNGPTVALTTAPAQVSMTATPPTGAVYARAVVQNVNSVVDGEVYGTLFGWGLGSVPVDDSPGRGVALTWAEVRTLVPALPVGERSGLPDYELPPGRPVVYRATTRTDPSDPAAMGSAPSSAVPLYADPTGRTVLLDPFQPERAVVVAIKPGHATTQDADEEVFHPLGRDGDPMVVRDYLAGRDGTWILQVTSDDDLARVQAMIGSHRPLLVQWFTGGQKYVRLIDRGVTSDPIFPGHHDVTVRYLHVARP